MSPEQETSPESANLIEEIKADLQTEMAKMDDWLEEYQAKKNETYYLIFAKARRLQEALLSLDSGDTEKTQDILKEKLQMFEWLQFDGQIDVGQNQNLIEEIITKLRRRLEVLG